MRKQLARTVPAVLLAAVVGGLGVKPTSRWYRELEKPSWNPPNQVFGPAWGLLYVLTAAGTAKALASSAPSAAAYERRSQEKTQLEKALWANMALNAGWCWLFFTAQKPRLALLEILVLEASTVDLVRRARALDPAAGALVAPYAAWTGFATALNADIVRRNG